MSFCRTITTYNNKSVQQKAKMASERRRQSQAWLRRQEEQKKPGAPHRPEISFADLELGERTMMLEEALLWDVIFLQRQLTGTGISSLSRIHFAIYVGSLVVMAQSKSYRGQIRYLWQHFFRYGLMGMEDQCLCGAHTY
jgi:hypothetical protein